MIVEDAERVESSEVLRKCFVLCLRGMMGTSKFVMVFEFAVEYDMSLLGSETSGDREA